MAGGEGGPELLPCEGAGDELPEWDADGHGCDEEGEGGGEGAGCGSCLAAEGERGGEVGAPVPCGVAAAEGHDEEEWGEDEWPTELDGGGVVEGGVEADPDFSGEDFYLEDGGDGEVVQGQDEREDGRLKDGGAGQGEEDPAEEGAAAEEGVGFEVDILEAAPCGGDEEEGDGPGEEGLDPDGSVEAVDVP